MAADSLQRLQEIVARLRAPDGCPWDREQTHLTLRRELLEECHEVLDALDSGDAVELQEELGDLLLQVVMHAQIASEAGQFDLNAVARGIAEKLVRRHPHVFADADAKTTGAVLKNWERIKAEEKPERHSRLDGIPRGLPALARAQKIQTRAARAGFDWSDANQVVDKVREEWAEFDQARKEGNFEEQRGEFGDLLFSMVNLARHLGFDAEAELASAARKFETRFRNMETQALARGEKFDDLALEEKERLWEKAKADT